MKILQRIKSEPLELKFNGLGKIDNVKIIVYNDSSFGNLDNGGSQGGFISFLANSFGDILPIMWQSKRLCRVVKSTMASETARQVEAVKAAFWVAKLYSEVTGNCIDESTNNVIPIGCFTDICQLVEAVYSISPILDQWLRIDISILREMLEKKEIKDVKWVNSKTQLSNSLINRGASSDLLINVLSTGKLH